MEFLHQLQGTCQVLLQAILSVQENRQFAKRVGDGGIFSVPLVRNGHDVTALMILPNGLIDLADPAQRLRAFYVIPVNAVCDLRSLFKASLADQRVDLIQAELKFVLIHFVFLVFHASETGLWLQLFLLLLFRTIPRTVFDPNGLLADDVLLAAVSRIHTVFQHKCNQNSSILPNFLASLANCSSESFSPRTDSDRPISRSASCTISRFTA